MSHVPKQNNKPLLIKFFNYKNHILDISRPSWHTWSDNKVCELITVKVIHTSLLNTTIVTFKVLPLGSYALIPALSPPYKIIFELVLWNGLQSCHCITADVINVIKMPSFNISFISGNSKHSCKLTLIQQIKIHWHCCTFTYQTEISAHFPTSLIKQHK